MSTVLAIAAVTQVLKDLLNDALVAGDASDDLGTDFSVTALPPDRVVNEDPTQQATQINLYLHRAVPSAALRNADLPTRDANGRLVTRPRLALDLHYILTVVAGDELLAEILLGHAMQAFHEQAVLSREAIRAALAGGSGDGPAGAVRDSRIADQIELLKITPHTLSMDDMSKMWTALQASYRTTVAYEVSLVLIERDLPTRAQTPVISRGGPADPATGRDPGIGVRVGLRQSAPALLALEPVDLQPAMRLGGGLALLGHAFDRGEARVRFAEPGTGLVLELLPSAPAAPDRIVAVLPSGAPLDGSDPAAGTGLDPGAWRIGAYAVSVRLTDGEGRETQTNALPIALAPASAASAVRNGASVEVTMTAEPPVRPGQSVAVLVGQAMELVDSPDAPADSVQADFDGLEAGTQLPVRLRIDGIDSAVIDRLADPPALVTLAVP